jgi:hypothetical protein
MSYTTSTLVLEMEEISGKVFNIYIYIYKISKSCDLGYVPALLLYRNLFYNQFVFKIEALPWMKFGSQDIGKYRNCIYSGHLFV